VASVVAIGGLLESVFSCDAGTTTRPDSVRARILLSTLSNRDRINEAVIIHSQHLTADAPAFRGLI